MALDPDYDLMRDLGPGEDAPTWSRFLGAGSKTVVLPTEDKATTYAPLLDMLQGMGCETVSLDKLENKAMEMGSFIFLGSSKQSRGLFADPGHAPGGFTLDVRKNPLARPPSTSTRRTPAATTGPTTPWGTATPA